MERGKFRRVVQASSPCLSVSLCCLASWVVQASLLGSSKPPVLATACHSAASLPVFRATTWRRILSHVATPNVRYPRSVCTVMLLVMSYTYRTVYLLILHGYVIFLPVDFQFQVVARVTKATPIPCKNKNYRPKAKSRYSTLCPKKNCGPELWR